MADTSTFMAVGRMPQVDYGAVYENAKLRREQQEQRKLEYLNQFQQERGAFTPGMQDQLQAEWDAIEADLDQGDMSFEAKARRQRMYNSYKQHAADALDYANQINTLEASVLADPTAYTDPAAIMQELRDARNVQVSANNIGLAIQEIPTLNEYRRFALPEVSPNAAAGMILQNLKTSGGINNFYDIAGTGELSPEAVSKSVMSWFNANGLSQEEEDQAIAYVMHQLGGLTGSMEDLSKLRNLTEDERKGYLEQYAQYVTGSLMNMLTEDIETQKEQDAREISMARRKARVQAEEEAAAAAASPKDIFDVEGGSLSYMPAITEDENGRAIKLKDPDLVDAGMSIHAKVEGTQPSYRDEFGNQYYIESIGVTNDGQRVAIVRSNQKVTNRSNKTETHSAHTVVPLSELPMGGLSNAKQADKINNTFEVMLDYWSDNLAGQETPQSQYQDDVDFLDSVEVEQGPMINQPPSPYVGVMQEPYVAPKSEYFPNITRQDWNEAAKDPGGQSKIITDLVRQEYGRIASLTPQQRRDARADIIAKLEEQLGIEI